VSQHLAYNLCFSWSLSPLQPVYITLQCRFWKGLYITNRLPVAAGDLVKVIILVGGKLGLDSLYPDTLSFGHWSLLSVYVYASLLQTLKSDLFTSHLSLSLICSQSLLTSACFRPNIQELTYNEHLQCFNHYSKMLCMY
jgi:hypothetical protein